MVFTGWGLLLVPLLILLTEGAGEIDRELITAPIFGLILLVIDFIIKARQKAPWTPVDEQKKEMIENFPIPNSKEDLIEFAMLASTRIRPAKNKLAEKTSLKVKYQQLWNEIWLIKCQQINLRAQIAMAEDPQSFKIIKDIFTKRNITV